MSFTPSIGGGLPGQYDSEAALYGKDLFFDGNTHLAQKGDYLTVEGPENLRQALIRRAMVRPGEFRKRPGYGAGLITYVKKRFTPTSKAEIVQRLSEQWALDRRVQKVDSVGIEEVAANGKSFFRVSFAVISKGQRLAFQPFLVPRQV